MSSLIVQSAAALLRQTPRTDSPAMGNSRDLWSWQFHFLSALAAIETPSATQVVTILLAKYGASATKRKFVTPTEGCHSDKAHASQGHQDAVPGGDDLCCWLSRLVVFACIPKRVPLAPSCALLHPQLQGHLRDFTIRLPMLRLSKMSNA